MNKREGSGYEEGSVVWMVLGGFWREDGLWVSEIMGFVRWTLKSRC